MKDGFDAKSLETRSTLFRSCVTRAAAVNPAECFNSAEENHHWFKLSQVIAFLSKADRKPLLLCIKYQLQVYRTDIYQFQMNQTGIFINQFLVNQTACLIELEKLTVVDKIRPCLSNVGRRIEVCASTNCQLTFVQVQGSDELHKKLRHNRENGKLHHG